MVGVKDQSLYAKGKSMHTLMHLYIHPTPNVRALCIEDDGKETYM
jgi:hypothetical protein